MTLCDSGMWINIRGSAMKCKPCSGRPKTAQTAENVENDARLICSQKDKPGVSKSMRQYSRAERQRLKHVGHYTSL